MQFRALMNVLRKLYLEEILVTAKFFLNMSAPFSETYLPVFPPSTNYFLILIIWKIV